VTTFANPLILKENIHISLIAISKPTDKIFITSYKLKKYRYQKEISVAKIGLIGAMCDKKCLSATDGRSHPIER
jgi:hypothetical protein